MSLLVKSILAPGKATATDLQSYLIGATITALTGVRTPGPVSGFVNFLALVEHQLGRRKYGRTSTKEAQESPNTLPLEKETNRDSTVCVQDF
jgi:hypothetical protein